MHINDPVNKNAIDDEFCLQLHGIVDTIKQDKTIKVLIWLDCLIYFVPVEPKRFYKA